MIFPSRRRKILDHRLSLQEVDRRVVRAMELMSASLSVKHTLATIAETVHLSPSRLSHLFKQQTGQSPMHVLLTARLRHAAQLLEVTELSVGAVAQQSGFCSLFHFSRQFSTYYGVSPSRYRRDELSRPASLPSPPAGVRSARGADPAASR